MAAALTQIRCKLAGCTNPIYIEKTDFGTIRHPFCGIVHAIQYGETPLRATAEHYRMAKNPAYIPPAPRKRESECLDSTKMVSPPSTPPLLSPSLSARSSDDESITTVTDCIDELDVHTKGRVDGI
ncbi:hypothetical protein BGW41_001930 [Actinomortierella wolfii]|nr:hypothetical protein BGW41_001930 [Actinomortierella wolfii]